MAAEEARERFLREALAEGARGAGRTHPNPCVGAVVVRGGRVIGRGWHRGPGTAHAEVDALREAGEGARGADLYVTLEPCCTWGRTPPCTDALAAVGLRRVVAAVQDPNPNVSGRGLDALRRAGIEVECPVLEAEAVALDAAYHHFYRKGRPYVHLKWAQSLDGRVTAAHGRYLTGPQARERVHRDRFAADALLVSAGTVLQDDPRLTVRLEGQSKPLVRVVVDRLGTLQPGGALFRTCPQEGPVWVVRPRGLSAPELPAREGLELLEVEGDGAGGLDLAALLALLRDRRIVRLYVEAVGALAHAFLGGEWVDRLSVHLAPVLRGGEVPAVPAFPGEGLSLAGAAVTAAGPDWIFERDLEGRCLPG